MSAELVFREIIFALVPNQAMSLWLGFIVLFLVGGDFRRLASRRNLTLLVLFVPAILFTDCMRWERIDGTEKALAILFNLIFGTTALFAVWGIFGAMMRPRAAELMLPVRALGFLAVLLVILNAAAVFGQLPEDSSNYTNVGAQRWLETGRAPYGDPLLLGPDSPGHGAAATYGPLLYALHIPIQAMLGDGSNGVDVDRVSGNKDYIRPKHVAAQTVCFLTQLLAVVSLFGIGRRLRSNAAGFALVCLYAGSPYILGLGDDRPMPFDGPFPHRTPWIGGITLVSHIAPNAAILAALWQIRRPFVSGLFLALGVGFLFYPIFLFPLFAAWFLWRRKGFLRFVLGFALLGGATAGLVYFSTDPVAEKSVVETFLEATVQHQEGVAAEGDQYGHSRFSFWGNQSEAVRGYWQEPLGSRGGALTSRAFLSFFGLSILAAFLAYRRDEVQFAFLVAAVSAGVQLWKTHAAGSYVEWYLPFMLIGLFCGGGPLRDEPAATSPEDPSEAAGRVA